MSTDKKITGKMNTGNTFTIVKYLILLAIAAFVICMVRENRGGTASYEDVRSAVEQAINQQIMHDVGRKGFRRYYNLNEADYDGVLLYQSVSGMSAEEILLVKLKDPSQAETVKAAIERRRESRVNDFSGYAPEEAALMEQAPLLVKGDYLLFLSYSQAEEVKQAFQGVF